MKRIMVAVLVMLCSIATQVVFPVEWKENPQCIEQLSDQDKHALELGRAVLKVKNALQRPEKQGAIDAIRELGLKSKYFVMVRGWIILHIRMTESYRGTTTYAKSEERKKEVEDRIKALGKMLQAIDLER